MGQAVRNVTISGKVLSVEGLHGGTYGVYFDDADDTLMQGDRKGTKPSKAATVTISQATGKATYDTTPQSFTAGTKHTVRFVDQSNGHVTLQSTFTAG